MVQSKIVLQYIGFGLNAATVSWWIFGGQLTEDKFTAPKIHKLVNWWMNCTQTAAGQGLHCVAFVEVNAQQIGIPLF